MSQILEQRTACAASMLLPQALLDLELTELGLPPAVYAACASQHVHTLGDLLAVEPTALAAGGWFGTEGSQLVRSVLTQYWQPSSRPGQPLTALPADFPALLQALEPALGPAHFPALCRLLRIPEPAGAAPASDGPLAQATLRGRLLAVAAPLFDQLCRELGAELHAFEGVVEPQHVAAGTTLAALLATAAPPTAVFELVAFVMPQQFTCEGGRIFGLPRRHLRAVQKALRRRLDAVAPPLPTAGLLDHLASSGCPAPIGIVHHCLRHELQLAVVVDPRLGEVAIADPRSPTSRLQALLAESPGPLSFDDLAFAWRERHRSCNRAALRRRLSGDQRFLRVGAETWDLRSRQAAELERTAPLAEQTARAVTARGGKHRLAALVAEFGGAAADAWLVADHLRRDVRVRRLGRGEVCPATHARSQVLEQLLLDFRRAGGEVVESRFLANQPPDRRRLVARLLHENRLFVSPGADRIDVLTNYPFNRERLKRLLGRVAEQLVRQGGHAHLADLRADLLGTELGGDWLTSNLLGDLLRRHAEVELLAGGLVCRKGTMRHLQRTLRSLLRSLERPATVADLLAADPGLGLFASALDELLAGDPLVASHDGHHYTTV